MAASQSNGTTPPVTAGEDRTLWQKVKDLNLKQYLTVEPALILIFLPSLLTVIINQNIELDKACRADLGLSSVVCDMVVDNPFDCDPILKENANLTDGETFDWEPHKLISDQDHHLYNFTVCKAYNEALKISSYYYGIRGPIGKLSIYVIELNWLSVNSNFIRFSYVFCLTVSCVWSISCLHILIAI